MTERSDRIRNVAVRVLADDWYVLRKASFELLGSDGVWRRHNREAYDRGNGAVILLHDPQRDTVLLIRQFRWPAYSNGHPDGMLLEAPAGLLDDDDPESAIRREAREETGVEVEDVQPVFAAYMSPGSVTERVHFFYAHYSADTAGDGGGGVADEGEDIEVVELPLAEALAMVRSGEIVDGKTIMLLQWLAGQRRPLPATR